MLNVLRNVRILIIIHIFRIAHCQDGFGEQDLLRLQQYISDDEKSNNLGYKNIERDSSYSPNTITSTIAHQYQSNDDTNQNNDFGQRSPYTRSRKVYRIKNPFQEQTDEADKQQEYTEPQDSDIGASNQYASMQYSLPPEEFLQQLRSENQYYQQTQISTPAPNTGYTATPQPQFQYSTPNNYENNNHQNNQVSLEPKISQGSTYLSNHIPHQYSTPNTFIQDNIQSTVSPIPSYLSTPINNGQSSPYISSASPVYFSSPLNQQSYVSSPFSIIQTGSPDYNNRFTSPISQNQGNFDNNRYSINVQQYQNDYTSTTTTSPYYDQSQNSWQNNQNSGVNAAPKSIQENIYNQHQNYANNQYQNYPYKTNEQDSRHENNADKTNTATNRVASMSAANNLYANYVQPDGQLLSNLKVQTRDLKSETDQGDVYSNGDYGWKMTGKKPLIDTLSSGNSNRHTLMNLEASNDVAVSQVNFHIGSSKPYTNFDQISKSATENIDPQEFAQAAAKAHEKFKQQQQQQRQQQLQQQQQQQQLQQQQQQQQQQLQQLQNIYANNNNFLTSNIGNNNDINNLGLSYFNSNEKLKDNHNENANTYPYLFGNVQSNSVTASPYYFTSPKDNLETKPKQQFDHEKALKNIVPIDATNVLGNSDSKKIINMENNGRFMSSTFGKDQLDQNVRQFIRPVTDSYFKDKNSIYGFNIKNHGDAFSSSDSYNKQADSYSKQQQLQDSYNQGYSGSPQNFLSYLGGTSNNYQDGLQSSSAPNPGILRSQNQPITDFNGNLKFSDIPYKLTQGLTNDALKLHNANFDQGMLPTPLPIKINQNVGSHQLDVTTNLLNKLFLNKQQNIASRPEIDSQTGSLISTINGFKVANPFNVDLKLVAEMLKGKPTVDDSHMLLRDQYTKPGPLKLDLSQLQLLLKNENNGNFASLNDGFGLGGPYIDIYNNGRFPYQGVKYSRSQEEEESLIPIAEASNTHPIGAVMEQDDPASEREVHQIHDFTAQGDDVIPGSFTDSRPRTHFSSGSRVIGDRHRHPNVLSPGRHSYQRKHPKSDAGEPYPLLKPPPAHSSIRGGHIKIDSKHSRRRRVHKPKFLRVMKTETVYDDDEETKDLESSVPRLLRPPPLLVEEKSDSNNPE